MTQKLFNVASILSLLVVLVLAFFAVAGGGEGVDPLVAQGTTHLTALTVAGELNAEQVTSTDDATIADDLTVSADLAIGGNTTLSGLLYSSFTNLTVTNGDTLTPTYTVYALDTAAGVTITLAASASEGQYLILINDDGNALVIADTNLRSSDGNKITLAGSYDIIMLVYQDTEWLELAKSANS